MKLQINSQLCAFLVLLGLTLGILAVGLALTIRPAGKAYEQALLNFVTTERLLDAELRSLEIGAGNHFDHLKEAVRALRRAEAPLSAVPRHLNSAANFNEARLQLAVLVNERLALIEDFKTSLAMLQVSLDGLPVRIDSALRESAQAGVSDGPLLAGAAGNLARFVCHPGENVETELQDQLASLTAAAGDEVTTNFKSELAAFARQGKDIVARKQALDGILLKLATTPLSGRAVELVERYETAELRHRQRVAASVGAAAILLVLALAILAIVGQYRLKKTLAMAVSEQTALKGALKEARSQSETAKRGEREQSALLAEERHNALVRHAFDLMTILSRQENYIYASPACNAFFGLNEKDMIGKSVYEGVHADDIIKLQDYLARAQRELPTEQTIQYRVMDAFGKWHLVETFASNQASNPAVRGMVLNTRRLGMAPDSKAR